MTQKYIEQIANLLNMLHSLDRDLNLLSFNETEKKISESDQESIAGGYGDMREIVDLVVLQEVKFK